MIPWESMQSTDYYHVGADFGSSNGYTTVTTSASTTPEPLTMSALQAAVRAIDPHRQERGSSSEDDSDTVESNPQPGPQPNPAIVFHYDEDSMESYRRRVPTLDPRDVTQVTMQRVRLLLSELRLQATSAHVAGQVSAMEGILDRYDAEHRRATSLVEPSTIPPTIPPTEMPEGSQTQSPDQPVPVFDANYGLGSDLVISQRIMHILGMRTERGGRIYSVPWTNGRTLQFKLVAQSPACAVVKLRYFGFRNAPNTAPAPRP